VFILCNVDVDGRHIQLEMLERPVRQFAVRPNYELGLDLLTCTQCIFT